MSGEVSERAPEHAPVRGLTWRALLCIALAVFAAILALLLRGPSCGHDFDFHLLSWLEVARAWREGVPWPHWVASANYGAGEPRLVFYPPGSWVLGAALGVVFGWTAAPILFTASCLAGGGMAMHRLARERLGTEIATGAAVLYVANPYTLFVVYERTAYGELLAVAVLPLLLLYALRARPGVAPLAAVVAIIWLANAPAGVIACYALLWLAVVRMGAERAVAPALRMGAAVLLGLGLDAFYLAPAAYEQRWVEIARAATAPGMRIRDSFLFLHAGEPYHDQVLRTASWLAVLLLAVAAVAYPLASRAARCRLGVPATLLPLILFLLLPPSAWVWEHAPHLRFLQFPWRWLMVACMLAALFAAAAVARLPRRRWQVIAVGIIATTSITICARAFYQRCDEEDAVSAQLALFGQGTGIEGTDEYTPAGADNSAVQQNLPPVRMLRAVDADAADSSREENPAWEPDSAAQVHAQVHLDHWALESKRFTMRVTAPGFAVLRLMDYPAWRVTVNGAALPARPHRDDGLMVVPVQAGVSAVDVRWAVTRDARTGAVLSLAALPVWIGVAGWEALSERRRRRQA